MVKAYLKYLLTLVLLCMSSLGFAQGVFATVTSNKSQVYVGEPVAITVSVYTPTWFTKGVDIGNLTVNGAFTVYFRSVSTSRKIKGQTYAGIQFIYNVFPFEEQDIVIPALNFEVESPTMGTSKGIRRKVQSKEKVIKIKPTPPEIDRDQWFVTGGMTVRENWKGNLKAVKVGDVIERTITRYTRNTVAELIPPILWDSIPSVSEYPIRPKVTTNKTRTAISATRTDGVKYLFEEEGEIVLEDMEFRWWNPYQKKYLKRTIKGRTIKVQPNPDLGILKTIKDSLQVNQEVLKAEETEEEAKTYFGLSLSEFLAVLVVVSIVFYLFIRYMLKVRKILSDKWAKYRASETYAFKRFLSDANSGDPGKAIPSLYHWIGHLKLNEPTLRALALASDSKELLTEIAAIEGVLQNKDVNHLSFNKKIWKRARMKLLKTRKQAPPNREWINP
ncbi:MAG: hypothetical protein HKN53_12215 [Maribacter sp.]|nr:hypothetical protein [Maribacter sp.]